MSYTIRMYKIFGIPVNIDQLISYKQYRGCTHDIAKGDKFCSQCGAPAYIEDKTALLPLIPFDTSKLSYFWSINESSEVLLGFMLDQVNCDNYSNLEHPPLLMMAASTPVAGLNQKRKQIETFCKKNNIEIDNTKIDTYVMLHHPY